jgi:transposase-like protein
MVGSTAYTDGWKAYDSLGSEGYGHRVVEHKTAFAVDYIDPATGASERVHTNRIEGAWKHAKAYFREMNGSSVSTFESHLCDIMFRNRVGEKAITATLDLIVKHYPCTQPPQVVVQSPIFSCWSGGAHDDPSVTILRADSSADEDDDDCHKEDSAGTRPRI